MAHGAALFPPLVVGTGQGTRDKRALFVEGKHLLMFV